MDNMGFVAEGGVAVTDDLLDAWALPWERGEVPGVAAGFVAAPGRPRLGEEQTRVVSLRLPASVIRACDERAARAGKTRSQLMRDAIVAAALSS